MDEVEKEMYAEMKSDSQARKKSNYEKSLKILDDNEIRYQIQNSKWHLVVYSQIGRFDFWPSTGKFIDRVNRTHGRGVFNLLKKVENHCVDTGRVDRMAWNPDEHVRKAAKFGKENGLDRVIIFAFKDDVEMRVTTWGKTKAKCKETAKVGKWLLKQYDKLFNRFR